MVGREVLWVFNMLEMNLVSLKFQRTLRRSLRTFPENISQKNASKAYYEQNMIFPKSDYKRSKCSLQENSKNPCLLDAFSKKQESVPKTFFLVLKMKISHTNVAKCNTAKKKHRTDNL